MSFSRFPKATATTTTDAPVIIEPGRTVDWPQQVILRIDGTPEGAEGWEHTYDARGSGSTRVDVLAGQRFAGSEIAVRASLTGGLNPVNPTPWLTIYRTVRGLIVGRQYRFAARVSPDANNGTRARIRMGGQSGAWVTSTAMTLQTVTFTATREEEDLIVEVEDNPATTTAQATVRLAVNDLSVTGLAYTQTIPPVVDDQVPLTVYEGRITADASWAPFIQADIAVPESSAAVAAALDPNDGSRVRVVASSVRELVAQYTPWTVTRRNIHPDPGHTGTSRAIGGGILMSCYEQMTGSNTGTTDKPNRFLLQDTGRIAQEINVKTLPAGASYGLSMTTNPPANGSTVARIYLAVEIDTFTGGGAVPSTMTVGVRVIQGSTTLLARTQDMTANGLTQLVINEVTLNTPAGPGGIRVEVYIINRAATTWTTPGTTVGVKARIKTEAFGIAPTDVAASPVISDAIGVSGSMANYLRYRKADNTIVEERRQDAAPVLQDVDQRTFDLAVAERVVDAVAGRMRLTLASDEYLLQRFARAVVDATPLTYQWSLRALIRYVLDKVIPGATLAPSPDVPVPALANSSNLIRNPRAGTNITDWRSTATAGGLTPLRQASGGPDNTTYVAYLSNSGVFTNNPEIYIDENVVSLSGSKQHVLSVDMGGVGGRALILDAVCFDASGNILGYIPAITKIMPATGVWQRVVTAPFEPYTNTAKIRCRVRALQVGGSEYINVTRWRLTEYTGDLAADGLYFDGDYPDTTQYDYEWAAVPHASISTRKVKIDAATPDALIWDAGQSAMDFLMPLVNSNGLRLWCDEARVWHLTDPANYTAPGALTITPATTVESLARVDGERGDYADAVVITWTWTDTNGVKRSRIESAGTEGKITTLEIPEPYPGEGTAAAYLARLQGRGTERPVTVASDYRATPDQPLTLTGRDGITSTGEIGAVTWDLTDGLMQIEPTALTTT
ncbi:hypothetical protein [Microbacterium sp. Leaf320]|uniref:hypothetical protein n=1 Tax=Microbacterium sp. Leaf320 TaxID=1736334 RepID=UPI0006F657AF|nr:hypothetical protein [Microbacterium sp. Leaf320]KQQ65199.1 hypothetical protein ASF63_14675 [Microbacterium sp. Leaf320]